MSLRSLKNLLVGLSLLVCTSAFAVPIVVDVAGVQSFGAAGAAGNTVLNVNVGAGSRITGIAYDVNVTAFTPSWLSEIGLYFGDSAQSTGVFFTPGFEDANPGTGSYADSADLIALGFDFEVGADGILRLEFFEDFNDAAISPDGIWNFGTITFDVTGDNVPVDPGTAIPEPATGMLLGAGLALMGLTARRRRTGARAA
ncbi:PEP-CTERM sorting domain-containing protein [Oxalobacteraceae sp. CFBP 13730]|nr:PEP-CTERM sorting domain-containing protein [Oxalobacteraceae sp. CFBP 13730]